jgi:hypothetical protein
MDLSTSASTPLIDVLGAPGPDKEHTEALMLFGRLVGSWDVEAMYFDHAGMKTGERRGEWHFGWVLEGRAVQDVLFGPPLEERGRTGEPAHEYGTTVRLYDPASGTWQVTWFPSVSRKVVHLVARPDGDGILLEGTEADGTLDRWTFTEITTDSFTWTGYESKDGGATWPMIERMLVRRHR